MIDRLLLAARRPDKPEAKAAYGPGLGFYLTDPPLQSFTNKPSDRCKRAQELANGNRWIRAAERAISTSFGTVPWHLETADGETVGDDSEPALRVIRDTLEKPYTPRKGDPVTATPRTRSGLWGLTSKHVGICGYAAWYLDMANALTGWPMQILYVNPARLTPAGEGGNLTGWVLDADDRGGGTPLAADQILLFTLDEPDWGFFPTGLVETALNDIQITRYADRHAVGTLGSGGKLPGVFAPRSDAGPMPDDVFKTLDKELRGSAVDPDSARRSIILKGPIDFTATAQTNEQLDVVAIQSMARDDILGLWGVPLSQIGMATPAGLNSGQKGGYEEAVFWQKAVGPRLGRFKEVNQFQLLDRLGLGIQLVIEEPTFDDDAPKYQMAVQATNLPLRNSERRALVGLDPLGDPNLDNAVYLPMNIVNVATAPEPAGTGKAGFQQAEAVPGLHRAVHNLVPRLADDLQSFLRRQQHEITTNIRNHADHIAKKPNDTSSWWDQQRWDKEMADVLKPYEAEIAKVTVQRTGQMLGAPLPHPPRLPPAKPS